MSLAERLHAKGWSQAEIDHALHHMQIAEERKTPLRKFLEESVYWFILIAIVGVELLFSYLLFPFFAALPSGLGYAASVVLGLVCGVLFGHVLHDIARLESRHHAFVLFLATFTALGASAYLAKHTMSLSIVFSASFILYYSYLWWRYER